MFEFVFSLMFDFMFVFFDPQSLLRRARQGQPARRRVHQRPTPPKPHSTKDRRDGLSGRATVRHLTSATGVARVRVQDPQPVPGDRVHPPRRHRRLQAQVSFARHREED